MRRACAGILKVAARRPAADRCLANAIVARSSDGWTRVPLVGLQARAYTAGRSTDSVRIASWRRRAAQLQRSFEADPGNPLRLTY